MSKEIKGDHKHLTLSDRVYIEQALLRGENFRTIAKALGKDPSTISLEIRKFVEWDDGRLALRPGNDCIRNGSCDKMKMCHRACSSKCRSCQFDHCSHVCPHYEPFLCDELESPPYVCNGCKVMSSCHASQIYYRAEEAHKRYRTLLSESRAGINMTPEDLERTR